MTAQSAGMQGHSAMLTPGPMADLCLVGKDRTEFTSVVEKAQAEVLVIHSRKKSSCQIKKLHENQHIVNNIYKCPLQ